MRQRQERTAEEPTGAAVGADSGRTGRRARWAVAATVVVAATALLTGCGGQDTDASAPQKVKGNAAPAEGDTPGEAPSKGGGDQSPASESAKGEGAAPAKGESGSGAVPSSGKGSGDAGTSGGACHTSELRAEFGPNHPGAGQENFSLVLTNNSSRTCTVTGYPGVAFVNSAGEEISINPNRVDGEKSTVKLAPGKSAWAPLSFTNPEMTNVTTVTPDAVKVTPPDERDSLTTDWSGGPVTNTGKASVPKIGPLSAGTGA